MVSPPGAGLQQGMHKSLMGAATPWVCKRAVQIGCLVRQRLGVSLGRDIRLGDDANWGLSMLSINSVKKRKTDILLELETRTPLQGWFLQLCREAQPELVGPCLLPAQEP